MRKTIIAAASIIALGLGTTAAVAQHGGHAGGSFGGGSFGGGHFGGASFGGGHFNGGMRMGPGPSAAAFGPARANFAASNNFAVGNRNFAAVNRGGANFAVNRFAVNRGARFGRFNTFGARTAFSANPAWRGNAFAWRGRNFAWRGRDFDRFHRRRFAFFPGFIGVGIYDYAGPSCYYDPDAPWTYSYYGYNNCYPYADYSYSYNWGW